MKIGIKCNSRTEAKIVDAKNTKQNRGQNYGCKVSTAIYIYIYILFETRGNLELALILGGTFKSVPQFRLISARTGSA